METRDLRDFVHFSPDGPIATEVFETARVWSQVICLDRNQYVGPIGDPHADAVFLVVAGRVVFQVDRRRSRLEQWEAGLVPAEVTVTNASEEPSVLFVLAAPPPAPTEPSPEVPPQS